MREAVRDRMGLRGAAMMGDPEGDGGRASTTASRAVLSGGQSHRAIHALVARVIREIGVTVGTLVDVGCGSGILADSLAGMYDRYVGCDLVAYDGFPRANWASFLTADLDLPAYPIPDGTGDIVAAIETIEHLENPRSFVRELARIARPGGVIVITTPNQLSLLSKLTFLVRNQFNVFQEGPGLYPAHITALLEGDLVRIARECGLVDVAIRYTDSGRVPMTPWHWPRWLRGRAFSDNVLIAARRAGP